MHSGDLFALEVKQMREVSLGTFSSHFNDSTEALVLLHFVLLDLWSVHLLDKILQNRLRREEWLRLNIDPKLLSICIWSATNRFQDDFKCSLVANGIIESLNKLHLFTLDLALRLLLPSIL